jgi:RNA polymerase sigma-70 factor (ECF subfamily)
VYLIFNEGYTASEGDRLVRGDVCAEAVRLGRVLFELMPDEPEVLGLLALMLLIEARRAARTDPSGNLVPLGQQDRQTWDRALIAEGHALVRKCLRLNRPGPYQLQAAINAVHTDAATAADTDWRQILQLYDQLLALTPTPIVALNRAVALAEVAGAEAGLDVVNSLELDQYHVFHSVRAELLRRLGRSADALAAYDRAMACTDNAVEREFLRRQRLEVSAPGV